MPVANNDSSWEMGHLASKGDLGGALTVPTGSHVTGAVGVENKMVMPFWVITRQGD